MRPPDDVEGVIAAELPDDLVEALISGDAYEPELPDELVGVGRLLRAAHGPVALEDRAREEDVINAMLDAMKVVPITAAASIGAARAKRSTRSTLRARRALVAVTAAAGVLGVGGVAAAAGNLPSPIQSFVHDTLSHVGVSVPHPDDPPATDDTDTNDTPDANVPAASRQDDPPTQTDGAGKSDQAPGQTGDNPGKSEDAPGHTGDNPGQSGTTPGQSGDNPGQGGAPPGQSGSAPGQSNAPSANGPGTNQGNPSAPGQQQN